MKYPDECKTASQKLEYTYAAQEKLRLVHNIMGDWYREGISREVWETLPYELQVRFPYAFTLTAEQWKEFQGIFLKATDKLSSSIGESREALKKSVLYNVELGDLLGLRSFK